MDLACPKCLLALWNVCIGQLERRMTLNRPVKSSLTEVIGEKLWKEEGCSGLQRSDPMSERSNVEQTKSAINTLGPLAGRA